MRVLLTLPRLEVGGVETHVSILARGLRAREHHVVVVSAGGKMVRHLERAGVVHHRLDVESRFPLRVILSIREMEKIMGKEEIQLVHAHSRMPAWISYFAARRAGIPFLTTAHSKYSTHFGSRIMAHGDSVITVSPDVADHFQEGFSLPNDEIEIIPEGIDIAQFNRPSRSAQEVRACYEIGPDDTVVGSVGRMTAVKGHRYLLEAFARLVRWSGGDGQRLFLMLVGDGSHRSRLEGLAGELGVEGRVVFTGVRTDIPELLSAMDVFVLSSLSEGLGLAALEAMAARKPVIMTRCGGLSQMLEDGKEALLVPRGDSEALAREIKVLLDSPGLRESLSMGGFELVCSRHSKESMLDETCRVYRKICAPV